jgi:O-antigen ligase
MGYAVSSGSLSAPYLNLLVVALFTSLIALIAVIVSATRLDWSGMERAVGRFWSALGAVGQLALSALATVALLIGMLLGFGGLLPDALRRDPAVLGLTAGAALILYWSPALFVSLVAAVVLFVIFYHRPDIGLMLTIFCAPFYLFPVDLYRFAFPMAELVLLLLAAAWALRQIIEWARGRQVASRAFPGPGVMGILQQMTWLDAGVVAYVGLGALALVWSAQRSPAVTELRVLFLEPALFYLILRATSRHRPDMPLKAVDALLAAAATVAVIGLLQFAAGASVIVAEGGSLRLASVYGSPNNAALFLGRALPFAFIMLLQREDQRRRIVAGAIFVLSGTALALTLSAGALFLGVPAALAVVLILQFGKRGLLGLAGLGVLFVGVLAVALQSERFARLANLGAGTSFFRVRVWQSAAQMIADHPVTGIGLDQFLYRYRGQYIAPDAWQEPDLSHPHNVALDFWLRLGMLGALLLILLQVAFWFRSLTIWRHTARTDWVRRALIIGAMGSMAGLLVHGLVDNSVFVNDLALVFMLLLAIPASLAVSQTVPSPDGL